MAILNNGVDAPQFWPTPTVGTKLANLTNWPSGMTAKVVRAFGSYLVAYGIFDVNDFPHTVHWSHPADPGTIPASWDHTDPTVDAGRKDLSDVNAGIIRDALPLQNTMMIYKEGSIWKQRFIGGRFIFEFTNFSDASGILAPRCVTATGDGLRHVVALQDDLVSHDGVSMDSILDKRLKKEIFDDIDPDNYLNCFMYTDPIHNEVVFCYPQAGSEQPNKAVAWNYKEGGKMGVLATRDITYRNVAIGVVEGALPELWSDGTDTWAEDTGPWGLVVRRKLVAAGTEAGKHFLLDSGLTRNGVGYEAVLQRTGLAIMGKKRTGEWIVDPKSMKMAKRVWPKVIGGPIRVRLGKQDKIGGPVTWSEYASFNAALNDYVDLLVTGRLVGVEFSTVDNVSWRIDGYKYEVERVGEF